MSKYVVGLLCVLAVGNGLLAALALRNAVGSGTPSDYQHAGYVVGTILLPALPVTAGVFSRRIRKSKAFAVAAIALLLIGLFRGVSATEAVLQQPIPEDSQFRVAFHNGCEQSCRAQADVPADCTGYCTCVTRELLHGLSRAEVSDIARSMRDGVIAPEHRRAIEETSLRCQARASLP